MTLIATYKGNRCTGRCDANCYNATSEKCDCICGGRNHGAGLVQAADNTRKYADDWIDAYSKQNKAIDPNDIKVNKKVFQSTCF